MCDEVRREVQRCDPLCLHPDALKAARLIRPSDNLIEIHSHTQPRQEPGYMKFLLQAAASAAAGYKSIFPAKEDFHWILQTPSNEVEVGDCYKMPLSWSQYGTRAVGPSSNFCNRGQADWQECFIEVDIVRGGRVAAALLPCCYVK